MSLHHAHDLEAPDLTHFKIREALAGLKRRKKSPPKSAAGPEILIEINAHLNEIEQKYRLVFWAACVLAFFSWLRRSNLFYARGEQGEASERGEQKRYLLGKSMAVTKSGVILSVFTIKTNKFKGEKIELPLQKISKSVSCPKRAVLSLQRQAGYSSTCPLLSYPNEAGESIPMTGALFKVYLKNILSKMGYDPSKHSIHSFRRGPQLMPLQLAYRLTSSKLRVTGRATASSCTLLATTPSVKCLLRLSARRFAVWVVGLFEPSKSSDMMNVLFILLISQRFGCYLLGIRDVRTIKFSSVFFVFRQKTQCAIMQCVPALAI